MRLFSRKKKQEQERISKEIISSELPKDEKLQVELNELSTIGDRREITKADTEVKQAVSEAARADIRNIMLIDQGRCPECHGRTENFLFTMVCPACGWFRRDVPEKGLSIVYLENGDKIQADYVHNGKDVYLCIRDGVVVSELARTTVKRVEHKWEKNELEQVRDRVRKIRPGVCSWCEKPLTEADEGGPFEDYVAFGVTQEHYVFCSEKCQISFRKQYPSRVHRNCYERDCNTCDLCVKRFDTHGFKRNIIR